MREVDEQLEFAQQITSRLETAGIPYMMTGSMAMAIYAVPRMTRDIDLVIECEPGDSQRIVDLFEADCYVNREQIHEALTARSMFNIIHNEWVLKADFIVRKDEQYRRLEFSRRRKFEVRGTTIWVVAPEDLILSKMQWSKKTASQLHAQDVKTLLQSIPDLDRSYLEEWARVLGLADLLEELRKK